MKTTSKALLLASLLALALAPSTRLGAQQDAAKSHDAFERDRADAAFWSHLSGMRKSTDLIGASVTDRPGHTLGKVADFLVDLSTGRVACALVMPPGGDAVNGYIPVPALALFVLGKNVTLTADKAILADVPRLSAGVTDPAALGKAAIHSFAYFNLKYVREDQAATHELWKASRLIGRKVKNNAGDNLGSLVNLMVDLRAGHLFFAIASLDGTDKNIYAIPPGALTVDRQEPSVLLDADRAKIAATSNRDGFLWSELVDPTWAVGAYRNFGQTPYSEQNGENVRAKVPDKAATAVQANIPVQPAGPTDEEISQNVMRAMSASGLGGSASKDVMVMASGGQVTLQGRVRSESLKQKLSLVAESVAGPGKVNNQLAVGK